MSSARMRLNRIELAAVLAGAALSSVSATASQNSPGVKAAGAQAHETGPAVPPSGTASRPSVGAAASAPTDQPTPTSHRYRPDRFAGGAGRYFRLVWGVEELTVRSAESGEVIRFSYRVLDPSKAETLNDGKNEPTLIDPRAGVQLVVPRMDKIGQLRQIAPPEAGKAYWMVFSNKGHPVKRGDHVIVQIGQFRADGLVVD